MNMLEIIKEQSGYIIAKVNITEANLNHSDQFKTELVSLLNKEQKNVWLSLEQVAYVDSSFLGALVAGLKHALGSGNDLMLLGLQKDVYDLLKLIRLDQVFKIYADEQTAKAALTQ
ncbi:STAS domain-containing protein [Mucilaginibacter sp. CSA2-8R]|uniref:STAS domain-containing protein n=1 Tax=Mucilaginibacter sp. CSA2-8R TaxID=3141542 RepID=UPI00315D72DE